MAESGGVRAAGTRHPWERRPKAYEGPGKRVVDLSLVRTFPFGTQRLEARIEAFNAYNWFRWGNPVTNFSSATFGRILTADDPRIMQFALKIPVLIERGTNV